MKLFYSPLSPYVRKVMIVAHELDLADTIERLPSAAHTVNRDRTIVEKNPLGQVPTALLEDGRMLADSGVICQYLNERAGGQIFPSAGNVRWTALVEQAVADGIMEALILARYEQNVRPADKLWPEWIAALQDKVATSLGWFERSAGNFGERFDIGPISLVCVLGYLDLRFSKMDWRGQHPSLGTWYAKIGARASVRATAPP